MKIHTLIIAGIMIAAPAMAQTDLDQGAKKDDLTSNHLGRGVAFFYGGKAWHNCKALSFDGTTVHFTSGEGEFDALWKDIPSDAQTRLLNSVQKLAQRSAGAAPVPTDQPLSVSATVTQVINNGALVSAKYHTTELHTAHTGVWDNVNHAWIGNTQKNVDVLKPLGDIYIAGDFSNVADGEAWTGTIWPAGVFHFTTASGTERTVRRWATSRELATKFLAEK